MNNITEKTYKDTVIRKLLRDEARAREVANALLNTSFGEEAKTKIHDLKDSLSARYNDISFEIGDMFIVLIEHQSTIDSNIVLRILIYFLRVLNSYYVKSENLYSKKLYKMPTPVFYVLYNGEAPLKKDIIRLSDHFELSHEFSIELTVKLIDINKNSNNKILEKSPSLKGYSHLIDLIRDSIKKGVDRDEAIKNALRECIDKKILHDFLQNNFEEIINMLNLEYDKETEIKIIRREEREEGKLEGKLEGRLEGKLEGKLEGVERMLELIKKGHSPEEAALLIKGA